MNIATYRIVSRIANEVRVWAEHQAGILGFGEELAGMCAVASARIHGLLNEHGIESKIVYSNSETYGDHCYVLVGDRIVDVTATQFEYFDFEPVVIKQINKETVRHYRFWRGVRMFDNVVQLIKFQENQEWPQEQMAMAA